MHTPPLPNLSAVKQIKALLILQLLLFSTCVYSQSFNYVRHQGSNLTGNGWAIDVVIKADNSILALYRAGNFDVDPSRYAEITNGCTVAKYDQQRRLQWNVSMGGEPSRIAEDNVGNIYIYGLEYTSFDADPGPGVFTLNAAAQGSGYIIELNASGQFVWAYMMNSYSSNLTSIAFDQSNNLYLYANFKGTLDIDPGAGVNNIVSAGSGASYDVILLKLSPAKNVIHALFLTGASSSSRNSGELFIENNTVYTAGYLYGQVNFNPLGVANLQNTAGVSKTFVAKYDTSLIFKNSVLWATQNIPHISSAGLGNVIVSGDCFATFDADPTAGTSILTNAGPYVIRLDTTLNYYWNFSLNSSSSILYRVIENTTGDILILGDFTATVDFDPGAANFSLTSVTAPEPDVFLGLYSSSGNFKTAIKVSSNAFKNIKNVSIGDAKRVFLPLGLRGTGDLDPGPGVVQYTTNGSVNQPLLIEYSLCTPSYTTISSAICRDATYTFGDSTYNQTGSHRWIYNSAGACDSIVTLNLTVNQPDTRFSCTRDTLRCFNPVGTSFQWINCTDNSVVPGQTNSYYFPPNNDSYAAIISSGGCTDTTQCVQRLQNSNPGNPALAWGSYWQGGAYFGPDKTLITDQYGNFYVTGYFYNGSTLRMNLWGGSDGVINHLGAGTSGDNDGFIAKYNNDGILQWAYPFGSTGSGGVDDKGASLAVDNNGNVYATGFYTKATDFDPEENNAVIMPPLSSVSTCCQGTAFILKLNASGQFVWVKTIGVSGRWVEPFSIAVAPDGSIAIGGAMDYSPSMDFDPGPGVAILSGGAFFAKYDNSGNYLGGLGIPETSSGGVSECTSVTFDHQNNLIVAGTMSDNTDFDPSAATYTLTSSALNMNYFLAKYSSTFNFMWAKKSGPHSLTIHPQTTIQTDCDDIIYVMRFATLSKYNTSGTLIYNYPLSAPGYSTGAGQLAFDLDNAGNAFITVQLNGTITLQPGKTLSTGGINKKLVAKYNKDGTNAWGFLIADATYGQSVGIAADEKGSVFIVGAGEDSAPFDIDPSAATYNLNTGIGGYVAKYGTVCSTINTAATISSDTTVMTVTANAYYLWKKCSNQAIVAEGLVPNFSPDSSGYYYCVINMGTCIDSTSCRYLAAPPSVYITSTSLGICPNSPITFTASSISMGPSPSYQWYLNGSAVSGATAANYTSSSLISGNTVYCKVTKAGPPIIILNTATLTVNVYPTYSSSSTVALCSGQTITVGSNVYSSTGNYVDTLATINGCDSIRTTNLTVSPIYSTSQSPVICAGQSITVGTSVYATSGTYTDTLSSFSSCDSIVTTNLSVNTVDTSVVPSASVLSATATPAIYQWLNCAANTTISGATAQNFSPSGTGSYAVAVTQNGCTDTSTCYLMTVTSIVENALVGAMTIYPNPFIGASTLTFSQAQTNLVIKIKGLLGNELRSTEFSGKQFVIEKDEISAGIYFVEILSENKVIVNKKIIIQ